MSQGIIYEEINREITSYQGVLQPKIKEIDNNLKIEFSDSDSWRVNLTVSLINNAYNPTKNQNHPFENFLDLIIKDLLKNNNILLDDIQPCKIYTKFEHIINVESSLYAHERNNWKEKSEKETIVVCGDSKSGKTTFVKQFCYEQQSNGGNILWLDFNRGYFDFSELLRKLIIGKNYKEKPLYIVLDNLECCGFKNATRIFNFFSDLIKILKKKQGTNNVQLILIQDENYPITKELNIDKISLSQSKTEEFLSSHSAKTPVTIAEEQFWTLFEELSNEEIGLLFKIILLNQYDISYILDDDDLTVINELMKQFRHIKLFFNNRVIFSSPSVCKRILFGFKQRKSSKLTSFYQNHSFLEKIKEVIQGLLGQMTIDDFQKFFIQSIYFISEQMTEDTKDNNNVLESANDFIELLDKVEKYKNRIIQDVNDNNMFNNHLGAILFAAETISGYAEENWEAMHAWKKIADYIYETYYISGQNLPEVARGKEKTDKTFLDFQKKEYENSIENQILLQNLILKNFYKGISVRSVKVKGNLDEEELIYYLSPFQLKETDKIDKIADLEKALDEKIDFKKFFGTYLLALLFEFEVTAPKEQRNLKRIQELWEKIKINTNDTDIREYEVLSENVIYELEEQTKSWDKITTPKDDKYAYFYPSRVPWVTARMLLALNEANRNNVIPNSDSDRISALKNNLKNFLIGCNIEVKVNDSDSYKIWTPGTGQWNTVLETTIMIANAIISLLDDESELDKILGYISNHIDVCFNNGLIAEGIWAYETCIYNKFVYKNVSEKISSLWKYFKGNCSDIQEEKNDISLGYTHIAKTLNNITKKLIEEIRSSNSSSIATLFNKQSETVSKKKVFISFYTETGKMVATSIYSWLSEEKQNVVPYNYAYNMKSGQWPAQLEQAILQADKYVLVITERALCSNNVLDEIKLILDLKREEDLIPYIVLESSEISIPEFLNEAIDNFIRHNNNEGKLDDVQVEKMKSILNYNNTNMVIQYPSLDKDGLIKQLMTYIRSK